MKCTCILILSSETYDQNVELFLPRKPFSSGQPAIDSDGTSYRIPRRLLQFVSFHMYFIEFLTFIACFFGLELNIIGSSQCFSFSV